MSGSEKWKEMRIQEIKLNRELNDKGPKIMSRSKTKRFLPSTHDLRETRRPFFYTGSLFKEREP